MPIKSVPGVADDSGFGGTTMQYQVLLDPGRLYGYHLTVPQVIQALSNNNSNAGGGFYSQGGQFYYVRGIGLVRDTKDIENIDCRRQQRHADTRHVISAQVEIGHAPRLGEFGFQKNDDAVEGVILMRRGEQTQNVLKGVEKKTEELNRAHPAKRRKDSSVLRPQRTCGIDHANRGRQSGTRHGAGLHRADLLPVQFPGGSYCFADHTAVAAIQLYFPARA